jgi:hypothetical protein
MILDAYLSFSWQSPTLTTDNLALGTGTYYSNNILDIGLNGLPVSGSGGGARDLGVGDDPALKLMVQVINAFTSGGAGTLAIVFQGAPDNGSGAPGAWVTWLTSNTYALATLTAGARLLDIDWPRPPAGVALPRFVRLGYTIGGAAMTAGTVTADAVLDRDDQIYGTTGLLSGYPPGIAIAN